MCTVCARRTWAQTRGLGRPQGICHMDLAPLPALQRTPTAPCTARKNLPGTLPPAGETCTCARFYILLPCSHGCTAKHALARRRVFCESISQPLCTFGHVSSVTACVPWSVVTAATTLTYKPGCQHGKRRTASRPCNFTTTHFTTSPMEK